MEGIENYNANQYLVVTTLTLIKGLVICNKNPRMDLSIFETLNAGFKLFKQYNILVPKPVIFIQVLSENENELIEFGDLEKFKVSQLPEALKFLFPEFGDFEIKNFYLPSFKNEKGEIKEEILALYYQKVEELINTINSIQNQTNMESRLNYMETVIRALNDHSPEMVYRINFDFFKNASDIIQQRLFSNKLETLLTENSSRELTNLIPYETFCGDPISFKPEFIDRSKHLPYYIDNDDYNNYLDTIECIIIPNDHLRTTYNLVIQRFISRMQSLGNRLVENDTRYFLSYIQNIVSNEIRNIKFKGSTYIPYSLITQVEQEKHRLRTELLRQTEESFTPPDSYLNHNLQTEWDHQIRQLECSWNTQICNAKWIHAITTSGDHKCHSCGFEHSPGVTHKGCDDSRWYWVDVQQITQYVLNVVN